MISGSQLLCQVSTGIEPIFRGMSRNLKLCEYNNEVTMSIYAKLLQGSAAKD
jgi:hypothetical protein